MIMILGLVREDDDGDGDGDGDGYIFIEKITNIEKKLNDNKYMKTTRKKK